MKSLLSMKRIKMAILAIQFAIAISKIKPITKYTTLKERRTEHSNMNESSVSEKETLSVFNIMSKDMIDYILDNSLICLQNVLHLTHQQYDTNNTIHWLWVSESSKNHGVKVMAPYLAVGGHVTDTESQLIWRCLASFHYKSCSHLMTLAKVSCLILTRNVARKHTAQRWNCRNRTLNESGKPQVYESSKVFLHLHFLTRDVTCHTIFGP